MSPVVLWVGGSVASPAVIFGCGVSTPLPVVFYVCIYIYACQFSARVFVYNVSVLLQVLQSASTLYTVLGELLGIRYT